MNCLAESSRISKEGFEYLFEATHYIEPVIVRGKGTTVWDADGNSYYDFNAGQFCMTFGHGYEPFMQAIMEQMKKIYHTNTATLTPEVFMAAQKMAEIAGGGLKKTLFLSTGAEANECALRYAKCVTGRNGVVALASGYHGLTLAAQSSTMGGKWAKPAVPDTYSVPVPDYIHSDHSLSEEDFLESCLKSLRDFLKKYGEKIAAFLIEPVIGVGGMVELPHKYLAEARKLCDNYGVLLIFDECQCGFGRSGDWFVFKQKQVEPDILVTAKAMGMGLAVSAVTFSEETAERAEGTLTHFSSHQNDPISAAAVSFVISEIENCGLLMENQRKGVYLLECLKNACSETDTLINPRGLGLMCAFDIDDSIVKDFRFYSTRFVKEMERNGILIQAIRQGRTFRIMPNYYVLEKEIDCLGEAIIRSVKSIY